jgi:hypothetical protein
MRIPRIPLLLVCVLASGAATAAPAVFDNPRIIRLGTHGYHQIQVADFDRDQKLDFAALELDSGATLNFTLLLFRGLGDGTFREPVSTTFTDPSPMRRIELRAGEVDGNSFPDLVVSFETETGGGHTAFRTFLGKGDGSFETVPQLDTSTLCSTSDFGLSDVTGDGRSDLILCHATVFPATVGGNFGAPILNDAPSAGGRVLVLDANGDGKRDVLMATEPVSFLLLGNGNGTFQPATQIEAGGGPMTAVGDLNGDGRTDMTWITPYRGDRSFMLAAPDGTFTGPAITPGYITNDSRDPALVTADLNGDGRADVVAGFGAHLYVWLTLPGGTAAAPKIYLAGGGARSLGIGDFDSDGKLDVLASGPSDQQYDDSISVALVRGNGDGTLHAERAYPVTHPFRDGRFQHVATAAVALSDVTGDGLPDLIAVTDANLEVFAGEAGGTFGTATATALDEHAHPVKPSFGDLDRDGALDVVIGLDGDKVQSWLANRDGTFRKHDVTTDLFPQQTAIGDFDGDGLLDLALIAASSVHVHRGRGDGTFGAVVATDESFATGPLRVADVNHDGRDDIFTAKWLLLGGPGGKLQVVGESYDLPPLLADLDADGALDLITGAKLFDDGSVRVEPGAANGTFRQGRTLWVSVFGPFFGASAAADFDGDGDLDVAFGPAVFLGDHHGWFDGYARFRLQGDVEAMAAGDVDGNGSADLVIATAPASTIDVIRTRTTVSRELPLALELTSTDHQVPLGNTFSAAATDHRTSSIAPGGAVLFSFRDQLTGIAELNRGVATGRLQALRVGTQPFTAAYSGDENYAATAAPGAGTIEVTRGLVTLAVSFDHTPRAGEPFRIKGRAMQTLPEPLPGGAATIVLDNVLVGTGTLPLFELPVGPLAQGSHQLIIEYPGDANYEPFSIVPSFFVDKPKLPRRRASGKP